MNVLIITSTFPRSTGDTQVPWLAKLARELKKRGVIPSIYAPSYQGLGSHMYHSIPVIRFRYAPAVFEILTHEEGAVFKLRDKPWLFIVAFLYLLFGIIAIIRMYPKHKFDVIHVHWPFPNGIFGIVAKKLFHAKLILTFHGAEFSLLRRVPSGRTILGFILKYADTVVANSSFTKRMIQQVLSKSVITIPFSSAVSVTKIEKKTKQLPKGIFRVLFVGRFIERKGISFLIDAIHYLHGKDVPVMLDIVGNGPLAGQIRKQIRQYSASSFITVHERISEAKLPNLYQNCDVFVLPAIIDRWGDTEGLGVVLIEAMSFGKPVVASRVGGIPDIVKHNITGLLVEEKNPKALSDALQIIYQKPLFRKRLGAYGLEYVKKHYNWDLILDKTIQMYKSL